MTTRRRDFGRTKTIDEFEPVEFVLNDETFHCKPAVQGGVLLKFVARADSESSGAAAEAIYEFFEKVMEPSEYLRFMEVLEDPKVIIEMDTIGEVATWLVEQYATRPTEQPKPSGRGRKTSGRSSTAKRSSRG